MKLKRLILPLLALTLVGCTPDVEEDPIPSKDPVLPNVDANELAEELIAPYENLGYSFSVDQLEESNESIDWTYWVGHEGTITSADVDETMKFIMSFYESGIEDATDYNANNQKEFTYDDINVYTQKLFGSDLDMSKVEREGTQINYRATGNKFLYDDVANTFITTKTERYEENRWYRLNTTDVTLNEDNIVIQTQVLFIEYNEIDPNANSRIYADASYTELVDEFENDEDPGQIFTVSFDDYADVLRSYEWTFAMDENGDYHFDSVRFLKDEFKGGNKDYSKTITLDPASTRVTNLMDPFTHFSSAYDSFAPINTEDKLDFTYFYLNADKGLGYDVIPDTVKYAIAFNEAYYYPQAENEHETEITYTLDMINSYTERIFNSDINDYSSIVTDGTYDLRYELFGYRTTLNLAYGDATATILPRCGTELSAKFNIIDAVQQNCIIEGKRREDTIKITVQGVWLQGNGTDTYQVYADPTYSTLLGEQKYEDNVSDTLCEIYQDQLSTYQWTFVRNQKDGLFYFDSVELIK